MRGPQARIESLLDRCERTERREHRISILQEVARLYEQELDDASTAYVVLLAALDEDYTFAPVAAALERLASELEVWGELIADRLTKVAELADDAPERAADLWVLIARWYDGALGETEYATEALRSALELVPEHGPALAALAAVLRAREAWLELAELTEQRARAHADPEPRAALWMELGALALDHLDDRELAIAAYRSLIREVPDSRPALDALERVYRDTGAWEQLVDVLGTKADATGADDERTALQLERARVLELRLGDDERADLQYQAVSPGTAVDVIEALLERRDGGVPIADLHWQLGRIQVLAGHEAAAERCFAQALVSRPDHLSALRALAAIYERRADWLKATKTLARAAQAVDEREVKLALRLREARIYDRELGHTDQAIACYDAVLALAPRDREAVRGLAELRYRAGHWEALAPILDRLLGEAEQDDEDDEGVQRGRAELWFRAGRCAEALDDDARAARCYASALDTDPDHEAALRARARLAFAAADWLAAIEAGEAVKARHASRLPDRERAELYERLGHAYRQRSQLDTALDRYEKALLFEPGSRPALEAVVELQTTAGHWHAVVSAQRSLLALADDDERFALYCAIGDALRDRLADPSGAVAAYRAAVELRPDDHGARQQLLDLYTRTRQWRDAVATIEQFAEREPDPVRKGKYFQAAATICRDELASDDDAIARFNLALDEYFRDPEIGRGRELPVFLKAFAAIDAILTSRRDWKLQERSYRQMIKRLPAGHPVLGELWHGLGEIYRTRLSKRQSAIAAFEVAAELAPDNAERRAILAELYVAAGPDRADKAIAAHRAILAADAWHYDSYHALAELFEHTERWDAAWCVCAALCFLQRSAPEERALFDRYRRNHPIAAKRSFSDAVWARVIPPNEHRYLSALLAAVSLPAARLRARSSRAAGVDPSTLVALDHTGPPIARAVDYARRVLGVPCPAIYTARERAGEVAMLGCLDRDPDRPVMLVQAHALANGDDKEVAFIAGRYTSYLRRDHFARVALPGDAELQGAIAAALRLAGADTPVDGAAARLANKLVPAARAVLQPHQLDQHRTVVKRYLDRGAPLDARAWRDAVDRTAHRVGLILCGDLEVATRVIARDHGPAGVSDSADDIRALVLYAISDEYVDVRDRLGLSS